MNTFAAGFFFIPALVVTVLFGFWLWGVADGAWQYRIRPELKRRGWLS